MIRNVALAAALWLAAAPASAQERYRAITTPANWTVIEIGRDSACGISQDYAGAGATSLGLSYDVDGEGVLHLLDPDSTIGEGSRFALSVRLAGARPHVADAQATGFRSGTRTGFMVRFRGEEFIDRFAAASRIAFYRSDGGRRRLIEDLSLDGSSEAVRHMRRCLAIVRGRVAREDDDRRRLAANPRGPAPSAAAPAPPAPRVNAPPQLRSGTITSEDYPASALRALAEGTTTVRLTVSGNGRVSGCVVVRSSGNSALDAATCAAMQRRLRFAPATDEHGNPVESTVERSMRWSLPQD